jgi:CheY-like chemotaxis protein
LVQMHAGSVEATSAGPGTGSEFIVRLPLVKSADLGVEHNTGSPEGARDVARKRRILLIEDSEDVREMLKDFLEELGHEVAVAANGLEGVEKLLQLKPDIALVDVGLPGIDGYEVARRIRFQPEGERLYLVALTGYGGPEAQAKAVGAGFDLHLTKPLNVAELPELINRPKTWSNDSSRGLTPPGENQVSLAVPH